MNLDKQELTALIHKIDNMKQTLEEIRRVVEVELAKASAKKEPVRRSLSDSKRLSDEELTRMYSDLRRRFAEIGSRAVEEFTAQMSAANLDRFVRANSIPIPTKQAKSETVEALANYLARSTLIRGV